MSSSTTQHYRPGGSRFPGSSERSPEPGPPERLVDQAEMLHLLESSEVTVANEIQSVLRDDLITGRSITLLPALIDHYTVSNSQRALDLIINVKEAQLNLLFDKLCETLKLHPIETFTVLSHLVLRQPSWLYRVAEHALFAHILKLLKVPRDIVVVVSGLFFLSSLLPLVPLLPQDKLNELFNVFYKVAQWLCQKQHDSFPEICGLHLKIALHAYFQRLYGMYPCNFYGYLRQKFMNSAREQMLVFDQTIRPLLEHVKMHPLLVTSTRESEMQKDRWLRQEPHDILVSCQNVSIDPIEVEANKYHTRSPSPPHVSSFRVSAPPSQKITPLAGPKVPNCDPENVVELLGISLPPRAYSLGRPPTPKEPAEKMWSPAYAVGMTTPPGQRSLSPAGSQLEIPGGSRAPSSLDSRSVFTTPDKDTRRKELANYAAQTRQRASFGQALGKLIRPRDQDEEPNIEMGRSPIRRKISADHASGISPNALNLQLLRHAPATELPLTRRPHRSGSLGFPPEAGGALPHVLPQLELAEEALEESTNTPRRLSADGPAKADGYQHQIDLETLPVLIKKLSTEHLLDNSLEEKADAEVVTLTQAPNDSKSGSASVQLTRNNSSASRLGVTERQRMGSVLDNCLDTSAGATPAPDATTPGSPTSPQGISWAASVDRIEKGKVPRLSTSGSVFDFMKEVNRMRFHSQCLNESDLAELELEDHGHEANCFRKRSVSCPPEGWKLLRTSESKDGKDNTMERMKKSLNVRFETVETETEDTGIEADMHKLDPEHAFKQYPYLKLIHMALPSRYEGRGDNGTGVDFDAAPRGLLHDYMDMSRKAFLMNLTKDLESGDISDSKETLMLKTRLGLMHQQLLYERYKKQMYSMRNRRLFGRLKQTLNLEELNSAYRDQLRLHELEIQNLIQALTDYRKTNREQRDEHVAKEFMLMEQLQKVHKDYADLQIQYDSLLGKFKSASGESITLKKELDQTKQALFNTEHELKLVQHKMQENQLLKQDVADLQRRLAAAHVMYEKMASTVSRPISTTRLSPSDARVQSLADASQREIHELKRALKREQTKSEAAGQKLLELEQNLHKKQLNIGELKRQMEHMRSGHKELLEALKMKHKALLAVCQRQEAHMLELSKQLAESNGAYARPMHRIINSEGSRKQSTVSTSAPLEIVRGFVEAEGSMHGSSGTSELYIPCLFDEVTAALPHGGGVGGMRSPLNE